MKILTPLEFRSLLKFSRSTEHRLLKRGMPCIGRGRLRRYDESVAVSWLHTHANSEPNPTGTQPIMLQAGDYRCRGCGFLGTVERTVPSAFCPRCKGQEWIFLSSP